MDRRWFFTWRTHGTWLPGEEGFVGNYTSPDGRRVTDNGSGWPKTEAIPALEAFSRSVLVGEPVLLTSVHAPIIFRQLQETAQFRGWHLDAVAVVANHVHIVFGVIGDPDPSDMLRDWKSYASRALNRAFGAGRAIRWWADGGSKRRVKDEEDRIGRIRYVRDRESPLLVWLSEEAHALAGAIGEPAA